ncbi:GntR family transcriptional regulator [Leifsonia aquatica]|jgi:DNA-binding GntR family transcriptional regulator|uniref:Transcriptional regulator, GntR family n=2 Tax=Leifsonia aquatica TaxID=144185 RepID=U2SM96_LEIAQ|nr:GntR family transcriptional regulator [Leifsonia aquatica]ERK66548.1 transcriptional regulator, GntR family [Leifsonia aquatica ATCC 14665]MBB2967486.1 DNA-binding GntR family transcriptional regulator [Leifsonia aquatica]
MTLDSITDHHPAPNRSADRRLLRNDVFELLLERIMDGSLEPGSRLKDAELTAWMRVSRTPVREALGKLGSIGLVQTSPNRYTIVAPLEGAEAADAIQVLRQLYPDAIRAGMAGLDADAELEVGLLAGRLDRDPDQNPVDVFVRIVQVVLDALPNGVLVEAVDTVHLRVLRYLRLAPCAADVLSRERVLAFAAALCAHDDRAGTIIESVLDDAERTVTAR